MTRASNHYTIFYFGNKTAISYGATLKARAQVSAYLLTAEDQTIAPTELEVKGEPDQRALETLIDTGDHRHFFVVPIANSVIGDVFNFMPFYAFHVIGEVDLPFKLVLCNASGRRVDIKKIVTKNAAFQQMIPILAQKGFDVDGLNGSNEKSTSENAESVKENSDLAAICSPEVCAEKGLQLVEDVAAERTTTFGIFVNEAGIVDHEQSRGLSASVRGECKLLLRNAKLYNGLVPGGGKAEFIERVSQKKTLTVKWGVDPLSSKLHLGHLACLYKLKEFQEFGHKIVVVLGTFTGQVGDPSGNLTPRPRYDSEKLKSNADAMRQQIARVLNGDNIRFEYNSDLLASLDLRRLLNWGYSIDQRLLLGRSDFQMRLKKDAPLSLSEMLYGLLQAYDTLVLETDVEVGGIDQLHNAVLMRNILRLEKRPSLAFALLLPLLPGLDGIAKMSAFLKNQVFLTDTRLTIRERLTKVSDSEHVETYMRLLTDVEEASISGLSRAVLHESISVAYFAEIMADAVLEKLDPRLEGLG